jgi:hypothetical protein
VKPLTKLRAWTLLRELNYKLRTLATLTSSHQRLRFTLKMQEFISLKANPMSFAGKAPPESMILTLKSFMRLAAISENYYNYFNLNYILIIKMKA